MFLDPHDIEKRMPAGDEEKKDNLEVFTRDHDQTKTYSVENPVQQIEFHIHQISLLPGNPCLLAQANNLGILLLAELEDPDIAEGYEDCAAEEGDGIEEPEGMVSWEKPN